jgi:hypothetical protein
MVSPWALPRRLTCTLWPSFVSFQPDSGVYSIETSEDRPPPNNQLVGKSE